MKKRTRRILFYSACVMFLIFGYAAILYAEGYKYSFSENSFVRTGAISLKVNTGAKVFLNDKLVGDTSFLTDAFSVGRLLPGQYVVRLQKDGYSTWQKKVTVSEGRLTDFPRAFLVDQAEENTTTLTADIERAFAAPDVMPTLAPLTTPGVRRTPTPAPVPVQSPSPGAVYLEKGFLRLATNAKPETLGTGVLGYSLSRGGGKIMFWTRHELWVYWIKDTDYQPFHKTGDKELVTRFNAQIGRAAWFADEDHVVVNAGGYRIVEIDTRGGINIIKI